MPNNFIFFRVGSLKALNFFKRWYILEFFSIVGQGSKNKWHSTSPIYLYWNRPNGDQINFSCLFFFFIALMILNLTWICSNIGTTTESDTSQDLSGGSSPANLLLQRSCQRTPANQSLQHLLPDSGKWSCYHR